MILLYVCFTDHNPHHFQYHHHDHVQKSVLPISTESADITHFLQNRHLTTRSSGAKYKKMSVCNKGDCILVN
jgi:hypothetical protein